MSHPWMPLYVGDYLGKTQRLNATEHGAYLLLIMEYWQSGGLPDDDNQLARICRMSAHEWRRIKQTVSAFFHSGWQHDRIDEELAKANVKHDRRVEAGKRGGIATHGRKQTSSNATSNAPPFAQASSSHPPSVPNGTGAPRAPSTEEKTLFDRGKAVLGKGSGGLITKLLKAKDGSFSQALAAIELAANKQDPVEYIGAVLRAPAGATVNADGTFSRWAI